MIRYKVQRYDEYSKEWINMLFLEGSKAYCRGAIDAMDSFYPCPKYRIVEIISDEVVYETNGRSTIHLN